MAAQVIRLDPPVSAVSPSSPKPRPEVAALGPAEVFADHVQGVARLLRRMGVDPVDLEDLCQEVFVVVLRRLPEFRGEAALRTWIYAICWRTVQGYRRQRARRRREQGLAPEPGVDAPQEREAESRARLHRLQRALDELDPSRRAIFVLYEIEGLSMREVTEVVGCPLQTGYSRLEAARARVREAVLDPDERSEPEAK